MKTKKAMIEELRQFVADLKIDCMPDIEGTKGIVVIVYSPSMLGSDDDMWHYVINTYEHAIDAMSRFAETSCSDSCVVTWKSGDKWDDILSNIEISISNMIFRLRD